MGLGADINIPVRTKIPFYLEIVENNEVIHYLGVIVVCGFVFQGNTDFITHYRVKFAPDGVNDISEASINFDQVYLLDYAFVQRIAKRVASGELEKLPVITSTEKE